MPGPSIKDTLAFAPAGGEMGTLIRALDWSSTPLGPPAQWSSSLRSTLSICLGSRFPIALYWGREQTLLYNDAWSSILGSKHPWALGRSGREVWPEIWDTIGPMFGEVFASGESTYSEDSLLAMERHGYVEECYFNYTFTPVRDESGAVAGIFNAVIETTYRVVSERRTRVLRELAEHLAGATTPADVCDRAARSLRSAAHDVPFFAVYLGDGARPLASFGVAIPSDSAAIGWPIAEILREGRARRLAVTPDHLDAEIPGAWPERSTEGMIAPFGSPSGLRGAVLIGASPRRAIDDDYLAFAERAAAHVGAALSSAVALEAERTRAEKLAELDRAKTVFFSNVSHELRTPLTLMMGPLDDAVAAGVPLTGEPLAAMQRNTLRLLKLVNSLLDFARLEAGRLQPTFEPVELAELTSALATSFEAAITRAGLALHLDLPALPEPVWVDRGMWEKIVLNLLSNALKSTFEGSITVSLVATADRAELRVTDTGVGIPEGDLPRIFERFHRVEGARARSHEGSGIGLALVRDLMSLHGGDVRVESDVSVGSTFIVTVPRGSAHLPKERLSRIVEPRSRELARALVSETEAWAEAPMREVLAAPSADAPLVLVADDNADLRAYLTRLFGGSARVLTAPNGVVALEHARSERPDLVITDAMMPELDGVGLLRALRADPTLASVPVMMLTARAGEESRLEGLEASADDYVVKPFSSKELLARARNLIGISRLRREAERERDHFQHLLRSAPIAINFHSGPDLVCDLAHPLSKEAFGGRELEGRPLLEAVPEHVGQQYATTLREVLETGEMREGRANRVILDRGQGPEETYWDYALLPVRDARGRVEGVMTCATDVTASVRARLGLEEANRAKDDFLAMLGHELRNPLAPIVTALALIQRQSPSGLDRPHAVIERQVRHLSRLVDDLLDVSRIARGMITLKVEPLELQDVVDAALESSAPLLEQKRHRLRVEVPWGLRIDGDRARLVQVVQNLVQNAAKFTDETGAVEIEGSREGTDVVLRVRDHGVGIAPEMLDRVFDMFVQSRQSLARSEGGLGLGLAIVKNIVSLHSGEVRAESAGVGKGSVFTMRLPASVSASAPQASVRQAPARPPSGGARLLIVDDNEDSAELLGIFFETEGYQVRTANDGTTGLALHESFAPTVAILDIGLPDLDGYELARRIRARGPETLLVALSGYGQPTDVARAKEAGFLRHLVKPVDMIKLASIVRELGGSEAQPA